jgi:hypothetical protein
MHFLVFRNRFGESLLSCCFLLLLLLLLPPPHAQGMCLTTSQRCWSSIQSSVRSLPCCLRRLEWQVRRLLMGTSSWHTQAHQQ